MDLNQILNTDTSWKGGRSSLHRPKPLGFTSSSHDLVIHQKSHPVNACSLRPQSEHKRNDTVCSLPSISSFDGPPRILSGLDFRQHQYESEQQCRSFSRYSAPRQSDLNGVQPNTSSVPTTYASTDSSSSDNSLMLGDLHIRPPRSVFDPSFSFQEGKSWCHCCFLDNTILSLLHHRVVKSTTLTVLQSPPISLRDTNLPSSQVALIWKQLRTDSETLIAESKTPLPTIPRPRSAPGRCRCSYPSRLPTLNRFVAQKPARFWRTAQPNLPSAKSHLTCSDATRVAPNRFPMVFGSGIVGSITSVPATATGSHSPGCNLTLCAGK